jgi:hypothetical protein
MESRDILCLLLKNSSNLETELISRDCELTKRNPGDRQVTCELSDIGNQIIMLDDSSSSLPNITLFLRKESFALDLLDKPECTPSGGKLSIVDGYMITATAAYSSTTSLRIMRIPREVSSNHTSTASSDDFYIAVSGRFSDRYIASFLHYLFSRGSTSKPNWLTSRYVLELDRNEEYDRRDVVQILGQTFSTATEAQMKNAFIDRGWKVSEEECWYVIVGKPSCAELYLELENSNNQQGISYIEADYYLGRVSGIDYLFKDQSSYLAFVGALDERYGTSVRKSENGCVFRNWEVGDIDITGSFCNQEEQKWRIAFMNFEIYEREQVARAINEMIVNSPISAFERRVPADMY